LIQIRLMKFFADSSEVVFDPLLFTVGFGGVFALYGPELGLVVRRYFAWFRVLVNTLVE
jgi:hypothetical protein